MRTDIDSSVTRLAAPTIEASEVSLWLQTDLEEALNWRYAVQQFDPTRQIPETVWRTLEESLRLAPSAYGLQPWKFIVVTDTQVKAELVEHSYGQSKIADASHLLVIAARTDYTPDDTARYMARTAEVREVEPASLGGFASMINGTAASLTAEERAAWLKRQVYIPLGMFLATAALLRVDAAPMEGFIAEEYDRVLGLTGSGYSTAVIAAAGYRAEDDKYASLPKVRYAHEDVFMHI
jgi:nitroreductase